MATHYFSEQVFEGIDFSDQPLEKGEYELCTFSNCDFSNADLSDFRFVDSEFVDCNLSNANLNRATINTVNFENCKLLGIAFEHCNEFLFSPHFRNCQLNYASFYKMDLRRTTFLHSQLHGVDFIQANLTNTRMSNCDLLNANFENTFLEKADLRQSVNYSIDPEINPIKGAKFSLHGVMGLLKKYQIIIDE